MQLNTEGVRRGTVMDQYNRCCQFQSGNGLVDLRKSRVDNKNSAHGSGAGEILNAEMQRLSPRILYFFLFLSGRQISQEGAMSYRLAVLPI